MRSKKTARKAKIKRPTRQVCPYCEAKTNPNYLNMEDLKQFLSDRAKIIKSDYSGVCSKHQRRLTIAIKRARHLALLPFTSKV